MRSFFIAVIIVLVVFTGISHSDGDKKKRFELEQVQLSWFDSEQLCKMKGGRLASHLSEEENQQVLDLIVKKKDPSYTLRDFLWLGGWCDSQDRNSCHWTDPRSPMKSSFTFWHDVLPDDLNGNERCLRFYKNAQTKEWKWDIGICTIPCHFICEYDY